MVQVQSGSRAAGWRLTGSFDAVSAHDVERGASFSTAFVDFPAFGPAGSFNVLPLRLQFALNGTPDAVAAVPEPTPAALLGVGLVGLWVSRRAKPGRGLAQYFKRA